jgi:Tol biopolymer transport system component
VRRLLSVAAVLLALPAVADAAPARIAFDSGDDVALINADGSGRSTLIHVTGRVAADPSWSPDGMRLALSITESKDLMARIYVAGADGSGIRRVTAQGSRSTLEFAPDWSPDGTRIAFVRMRFARSGVRTSVVVVNADGSGERALVRANSRPFGGIEDVTWSPDGARLLYSRSERAKSDFYRPSLWSVAPDGSGRHRVARDARTPSFAPDGGRVAYIGVKVPRRRTCPDENGCVLPGHVYVSDATGGNARRLTSGRGRDETPAWSPDGARILFASDRNYPDGDESDELYAITPDGACLTWVTNGTPGSDFPDWEPGAALSSDPGGCGATARAPTVNVDLTGAFAFQRTTVYWLGPTAPDGLLLATIDPGDEGVRLDYGDCGAFDPSACPKGTFDVYSTPACPQAGPVFETLDARLRMHRGALVVTDGGSATVWTGSTVVYIFGRGGRDQLLAQLRPLGSGLPTAQLPAAALPNRLWRQLDRLAHAKTRSKARRARAIRSKLRRLGVGRLRC